MKILSLNTAMDGVGVGFYDPDSDQSAARQMETVRGQAENLIPMAQGVLADVGVKFADLGAIVTVIGPGSFTGLRLCLSAAKSFSLALDIPVYGVTSLQALALQYVRDHKGEREICVVIETKRSDYYAQVFSATGYAVSEAASLEGDALDALLADFAGVVIGDAALRYSEQASIDTLDFVSGYEGIEADYLARLYTQAPEWFTDAVEPLYLRGADVSISKRKQRALGA